MNARSQLSMKLIIDKGGIETLDLLLSSAYSEIQMTALLFLGNISCEKVEYRDRII